MKRLCLDYSNPGDWDSEKLMLTNVDIVSCFNVGRANAEGHLNLFKKYQGAVSDFSQIAAEGYTLKIPYGSRKIGFNPEDIDYSLSLGNVEEVEEAINNNDAPEDELEDAPSTSIIDMVEQTQSDALSNAQKHDPQIEVDGTYLYKVSIVKSLFISNPSITESQGIDKIHRK